MPKIITGTVVSDKVDKTIVISVVTRKTHPLYKKQYNESKKLMVHDANNEAKLGDTVSAVETRPISARKRFTLKKVIERAAIKHVEPEEVPEEKK